MIFIVFFFSLLRLFSFALYRCTHSGASFNFIFYKKAVQFVIFVVSPFGCCAVFLVFFSVVDFTVDAIRFETISSTSSGTTERNEVKKSIDRAPNTIIIFVDFHFTFIACSRAFAIRFFLIFSLFFFLFNFGFASNNFRNASDCCACVAVCALRVFVYVFRLCNCRFPIVMFNHWSEWEKCVHHFDDDKKKKESKKCCHRIMLQNVVNMNVRACTITRSLRSSSIQFQKQNFKLHFYYIISLLASLRSLIRLIFVPRFYFIRHRIRSFVCHSIRFSLCVSFSFSFTALFSCFSSLVFRLSAKRIRQSLR